jgi:hypothetical protein
MLFSPMAAPRLSPTELTAMDTLLMSSTKVKPSTQNTNLPHMPHPLTLPPVPTYILPLSTVLLPWLHQSILLLPRRFPSTNSEIYLKENYIYWCNYYALCASNRKKKYEFEIQRFLSDFRSFYRQTITEFCLVSENKQMTTISIEQKVLVKNQQPQVKCF